MPARPPLNAVPPTPVRVVEEVFHGTAVRDPYRWLEDSSAPEVQRWTDAQNARTRRWLDAAPGRAEVERRLGQLMTIDDVGLPAIRGGRWFHSRREGAVDQPVRYWREGADGADRVLIDPQALDPSGLTVVDWVSPSPDGRLAAYGTYRAGDENTTLQLLEVDTGRRLELEIPGKTEAPDWLPDGAGFVYRNLRDAQDPYSGQICLHRFGAPPAADLVLFRQLTAAEDSDLATTWGPFGSLSRDGRWLLLGYWTDTRSNDLWLVDFEEVRRTGHVERREVVRGRGGRTTGVAIGDGLVLHTTVGAPRGRVVAAPTATPAVEHWRELVSEHADAAIESLDAAQEAIAVTYLERASHVTRVFDLSGRSRGVIRQPGLGSTAIATEPDRTEGHLRFTSFGRPAEIYRVDLRKPDAEPVAWAVPPAPFDTHDVQVEQVHYRSTDGTPISMFIVRHRRTSRLEPAPTVLYGYGGFNISLTPAFSAPMVGWLESGGVYALPNLRGGGEYGESWHAAGLRERRQQVFDDFIAAAEWLAAERVTTPDQLALAGGSNGGLLVGAAITQRPDLCRAAVISVPLLDMLRYQHFLMARYWVPEYGSAEEADAFGYLHGYSPYHRVRAGTAYPAVLLTAGEHDARVHPMHARKMAAALQAATSSDPVEQPVFLWVDREAGHGQGKPLALRLRDAVDQRGFYDLVLRARC